MNMGSNCSSLNFCWRNRRCMSKYTLTKPTHQQSEYHRTAKGPSSKAVVEGFQWMKSSVIR